LISWLFYFWLFVLETYEISYHNRMGWYKNRLQLETQVPKIILLSHPLLCCLIEYNNTIFWLVFFKTDDISYHIIILKALCWNTCNGIKTDFMVPQLPRICLLFHPLYC